MRASAFVFASDLDDEGFDRVLDNLGERAGLDGIVFAATYHHARDVFPHNPARKVGFHEGGATFFAFDGRRYDGLALQPLGSDLLKRYDPLERLLQKADARGLTVRAWTNNLHNTALASSHLDCAVRNAFGDPYLTYLCPANPQVRAFVGALSADIASYGVEELLLESLSYQTFDHGYHHERCFLPLTECDRILLGLCFCEHCARHAGELGVDAERTAAAVRDHLEYVFRGEPRSLGAGDATRASLAELADGELGSFLAAREAVVATLVAEVAAAVRRTSSTRVVFMEMSGGHMGYASGEPMGPPAPTRAWQDGVDIARVANACDGLAVLGYARDPARIVLDVDSYSKIAGSTSLAVAVRPMHPDAESVENVRAKVAALRRFDPRWIDFYHYGLMPLRSLDWIRSALHDQ